jgi:hypothetical protein
VRLSSGPAAPATVSAKKIAPTRRHRKKVNVVTSAS